MKNKTVKLILALIILGVLTGGYIGLKSYIASQESEEMAPEEEEENTNVFAVETDSITSLKFMIDKQEVAFAKEDGNWVKEDEKDFPVNQDILNNAVSYISSIDAERVLEGVEDLTEYGLESPLNTITISTDDDKKTILRIGDENKSTNQYYVRKDDDKSIVYVVEETLIIPFMNSLYDYAEKEDFPAIDSSAVYNIMVDQNENSYEAVKDENTGLWSINTEEYEDEKADSTKMNSLTSSLSTLEYESFVDYDCTDKSKYGLDQPYATVTIDYREEVETDTGSENMDETDNESVEIENTETVSDENQNDTANVSDADEIIEDEKQSEDELETITFDKETILFVGNETDSDSRYVMIDGSNEVYTMTNDLLSTIIDKDVPSMWDMTVNYVALDNVDGLDVKIDEESYTINVSRETLTVEDEESLEENSEDESDESDVDSENEKSEVETETETVVTYKMNGEEMDNLDFSSFYNKLVNMSGNKRLTEEYHPKESPEISITFRKTDGTNVNVDYYEYDVNYYAAVVDNSKVYLVNKMTFRELRSAFEKLIRTEG